MTIQATTVSVGSKLNSARNRGVGKLTHWRRTRSDQAELFWKKSENSTFNRLRGKAPKLGAIKTSSDRGNV